MQNNGFAALLWAVALRAFFSPQRENSVRPNFPGGLQLIKRAFSFLLSAAVSSALPSPFLSLRSNFPQHAEISATSTLLQASTVQGQLALTMKLLIAASILPPKNFPPPPPPPPHPITPPPPPASENSSRWYTCWSVVCLILHSKSNPEVPSASPFRLPSVFPLFSPYLRVFFFLGSHVFPSYF